MASSYLTVYMLLQIIAEKKREEDIGELMQKFELHQTEEDKA